MKSEIATLPGGGRLSVALQPIVELTPKGPELHALECLVRGPKGPLETPAALFAWARLRGEEAELDRACVELGLASAANLPAARISVNVNAATLAADPGFPSFLETVAWGHAVPASRLVVEISGFGDYAGRHEWRVAVRALREMRVRLALDDAGLGDANFGALMDLKPDYLKADRYLVEGIADDPSKRAILEALVSLGQAVGFRLVVEGVETLAELRTLRLLGVELVQGNHFSQPVSPVVVRRGELFTRDNVWDEMHAR
jgi:EAL domain-containing protein (putative c-di-GMP-specific phosphodiesterase class I)